MDLCWDTSGHRPTGASDGCFWPAVLATYKLFTLQTHSFSCSGSSQEPTHRSFLESERGGRQAGNEKKGKQEDAAVQSNRENIRWPQECWVFGSDLSPASRTATAVASCLWMQFAWGAKVPGLTRWSWFDFPSPPVSCDSIILSREGRRKGGKGRREGEGGKQVDEASWKRKEGNEEDCHSKEEHNTDLPKVFLM